ncbi:MAG: hypothetical protein ACRDFQ_02595 [Anaerolineales bacterium]
MNVLAGDESASASYRAAAAGLWALGEEAMVEFAGNGIKVHVVGSVAEVRATVGN